MTLVSVFTTLVIAGIGFVLGEFVGKMRALRQWQRERREVAELRSQLLDEYDDAIEASKGREAELAKFAQDYGLSRKQEGT